MNKPTHLLVLPKFNQSRLMKSSWKSDVEQRRPANEIRYVKQSEKIATAMGLGETASERSSVAPNLFGGICFYSVFRTSRDIPSRRIPWIHYAANAFTCVARLEEAS